METQLQIELVGNKVEFPPAEAQLGPTKAAQVCRRFGLQPTDFVRKWMAFAVNRNLEMHALTLVALDQFTRDLEKSERKDQKAGVGGGSGAGGSGTTFTKQSLQQRVTTSISPASSARTDDVFAAFDLGDEINSRIREKQQQDAATAAAAKRASFGGTSGMRRGIPTTPGGVPGTPMGSAGTPSGDGLSPPSSDSVTGYGL